MASIDIINEIRHNGLFIIYTLHSTDSLTILVFTLLTIQIYIIFQSRQYDRLVAKIYDYEEAMENQS